VKLAQDNIIQQIRAGRADRIFWSTSAFRKPSSANHPYSFVVPDEKSISALTRTICVASVATYFIPNTSHLIGLSATSILIKRSRRLKKLLAVGRVALCQPKGIHRCRHATSDKIYFVNRPGSIQSGDLHRHVSIPRKDNDYLPFVRQTLFTAAHSIRV